jgi:hypothetical protein
LNISQDKISVPLYGVLPAYLTFGELDAALLKILKTQICTFYLSCTILYCTSPIHFKISCISVTVSNSKIEVIRFENHGAV